MIRTTGSDTQERFKKKKAALITQIVDLRRRGTKQKAILSLKYETLTKVVNRIQVSVIVLSAMITLLESIKGVMELRDSIFWDLVPIVISTYIALVVAIMRFYKWEIQKENISKCQEVHTGIVNRLEKMYNIIINFDWSPDKEERWQTVISSFDDLFDSFVAAKETFDTLLSYRDHIYYKNKYKALYLKMEFANQDIELIRRNSGLRHENYLVNNSLASRWCCCYPKQRLDYRKFYTDAYARLGLDEKADDQDSMLSSVTYDSYEQHDKEPRDSMISDVDRPVVHAVIRPAVRRPPPPPPPSPHRSDYSIEDLETNLPPTTSV